MTWGLVAGAAIGTVGAVASANSAKSAAKDSSDAQLQAAQISAEAAKFRPVGITTRFGSSNFNLDSNGNLIPQGFDEKAYLAANPDVAAAVARGEMSAQAHYDNYGKAEGRQGFFQGPMTGYNVDPQLASMRDYLIGQAGREGQFVGNQAFNKGFGLFNMGSDIASQGPDGYAADWMSKQQNLLAPTRERQLAGVRQGLFNNGRTGLAVGATGARPDGSEGLSAANPEMEAYYNALAQQDAGLASQAMEQGRGQVNFGVGLMNTGMQQATNAYAPMNSWLGSSDTIDALGRNALTIGSELGGRASTAGSQAGHFLFQGGVNAAKTMQGVNGYSPIGGMLTGAANNTQLMNGIGGLFSRSGSGGGFVPDPNAYAFSGSGAPSWM